MSRRASQRWDQEILLVTWLAACVSLVSFLYYLRHGDLLLYGDAVAHINIARRVFDSRTPGLLQLGTVWLPLPHLLMIPFLLSDRMWQSGVGGSIPSMIAYVFSVAGIFRLMRSSLSFYLEPGIPERLAAWIAALIFAANPNLIYLQTTAMTEPLYLAFFIWAVVYFSEWSAADESKSLIKSGGCLFAACLTRYDGWFLAGLICTVAGLAWIKKKSAVSISRGSLAKFLLLAAAAPVLWLTYNAVVYRNPLEFANGPYSAKAIEQKTSVPGYPPHPGTNNLSVAASYFLKAAELNMAESPWHRLWLALLLAGTLLVMLFSRRLWPLLLLWAPLPFYMLSIAYGGVPIFLPPWWPFSIYNARYGIEILPAFAIFSTVAAYFIARALKQNTAKLTVAAVMIVFIGLSYFSVWRAQPISFREAWVNSRTRIALEKELANTLERLPAGSTFLMYLGNHVGAMQAAGIPLRNVINEGNHRTWKQPADPQGLWEKALANPARYVDFVVSFAGDPVDEAVSRQNLSALAVIHAAGQPKAVLYRTNRPLR